MIDSSTIDRIFAAANIVEVVSDFVTLRKKGINYQACCPFHNEKTPSFVVSPAKGLFKCFGCGKGGNAVTFVMEHEGLGYVESLKFVAKKYGIEVQEREMSPDEVRRNDDRESMLIVSSYASDYFVDQLHNSDEGRSIGLSYFRERGVSEAMIQRFKLGYCPSKGDAFTNAALAAGYKEEFLISTGLSGKRDDERRYDRFFGRVMFPIHSISGRVTAFGGRTLRTDKKVSKYVNSPESEIYHKSNILYGLFFAKKAITQEDYCILVEGYTDVISMHQSGVENVVSSSGTSLTVEQVRLISRFTKNITVIYDGDAAGIKASLRGIDIILREGMNVRIVLLPDGDDPDSFARKHTATELRDYIRSAEEDFISFKARILLDDAKGDPIKRAALITDVVSSIAEIPDNIMRSLYITDSSRTLEISEQILSQEVARKRISHTSDAHTKEFIRNQEQQRRRDNEWASGTEFASSNQPAIVDYTVQAAGCSMEQLEKELVKFLMKYGDKSFDYKEGKGFVSLNVAEVIIGDLKANGMELRNTEYNAIYKTYCELREKRREEGSTLPIEAHNFVNHHNPEVCNAAVNILTTDDNYKISEIWTRHDVANEKEDDILAEIIPKAVILYKSKAIEAIIKELQAKLSDSALSEDDQLEVLRKISALNKERLSIANRLQRLML